MLTGKDRKSFEQALKKIFNDVVLDAFFKDNEQIQIEKLKGSKQLLYTTDSYPAFVDATGKGDFFPTLYIVSEYPILIGEIHIKDGIESLLLGGGNLTWEGVNNIKNLGDFNKDDVRAIISAGKLIALGAMGSESKNINQAEPAAYILHTIQDQLWEYGPKTLIPSKPQWNIIIQFTRKIEVVKPIEQPQIEKQKDKVKEDEVKEQSSSDEDDNLMMLMGGLKGKIQQKKQSKKPEAQQKQQVQVQQQKVLSSDDDEEDKKKNRKIKKQQDKKKNIADESEERKDQSTMPTKVMDEYIKEAFMNSIKVGVNDKDLPIDSNIFQSQYLQAYKKQNVELEFKNSSYGKIGKFLQTMAKDGLIEYKESKKGTNPQIESIDRTNNLYDAWQPTILKANTQESQQNNQKDNGPQSYNLNLEIQQLYKPEGSLASLFEPKDKDDNLWTADEIKKAVIKKCVVDKKRLQVKDNLLLQLIIDDQDEEEEEPKHDQQQQDDSQKKKRGKKVEKDITTQEILIPKVLDSLTKFYQSTHPVTKKKEVLNGTFKGLQIVAEKQHNKNVTVINGIEMFGFDHTLKPENIYHPNQLLNKLQEKFSTTGSVQNGKQILLQGIFLDEVQDFFVNECKMNVAHIHQNNKIALKKKPQTVNMR